MDLSALLDRVRRNTNGIYVDTFHMIDLINDALKQLVEGARLRGMQNIALVAGTDTYPLPEDFKSPGTMVDMNNDCYVEYELVDIANNCPGYAIEGSAIYIKPVPMAAKNLTHLYYKYATELVNPTDVPEIDANYHDLLAFYASSIILLLPELPGTDKGLSDRYKVRWEEGRSSFYQNMQRKNKASRGKVVNTW